MSKWFHEKKSEVFFMTFIGDCRVAFVTENNLSSVQYSK